MARSNVQRRGRIYERLQFSAGGREEADWSAVDERLLRRLIANAARGGGAVRFGYTRDGGAYAVGLYGDGEPYTVYVRPTEDVEAILAQIAEGFEDLGAGAPK